MKLRALQQIATVGVSLATQPLMLKPGLSGDPRRSFGAALARPIPMLLAVCAILTGALALSGCRPSPSEDSGAGASPEGAYRVKGTTDSLAGVTLIDQHGQSVSLDSLKGKFVLIDFIYTSCPGPCAMMTAKIAVAARQLKNTSGSPLTIVSVTLDPEHDGPAQLLKFARDQGAEQPNWLFLTGPPDRIEALMARFKLKRGREPDGSIDHAAIIYLLDPSGRQMRIYDPNAIRSEMLAADILAALHQG